MSLDLIHYVNREYTGPRIRIVLMSLASGLSRGMLLAIINAAAEAAALDKTAHTLVVGFLFCLMLYLWANYYSLSRAEMMVQGLIQRLRMRICDKLMRADLLFIEEKEKGDLYTQLTHDINELSYSALLLLKLFQAVVLLVCCLVYIGWLTGIGLLIAIITLLCGLGAYYVQERKAIHTMRRSRVKEAEFFDGLRDMLGGFKEIKMHRRRHAQFKDHIVDISHDYKELNIKSGVLFIHSFLISQIFMFIMIAILIFVLPSIQLDQNLVIFKFLTAVLFLMGPLEGIVTSIPGLTWAKVALENITRLEQDLDANIESLDLDTKADVTFSRTLQLDGVCFTFPGGEQDDGFELGPIDLELKRGEVVFLVGGNGSGKTTFLKLLAGLYPPASGTIFTDGEPRSTSDHAAYRQLFSAIFGNFHLFRQLFGITVKDEKLLAQLLERLELADKTSIRDRVFSNLDLSTGQRKRLAYIVSELEDKPVIIFDEFAADQDPHFRRLFYRELLVELKRRGKTVIAATHDDNYFDACDRLIKLDYGRIVHEERAPAVRG